MSVMNRQKFQQLAISVRSGFGGSITTGAPTDHPAGRRHRGAPSHRLQQPSDRPGAAVPGPDRAMQHARRRTRSGSTTPSRSCRPTSSSTTSTADACGAGRARAGRNGHDRQDAVLARRGRPASRRMGLLDKVAQVINTVPNQVRVEGHTDNLPIHTARFPSNWELSAVRATTVLRYFESRRRRGERLGPPATPTSTRSPLTTSERAPGAQPPCRDRHPETLPIMTARTRHKCRFPVKVLVLRKVQSAGSR